ncbi:MAG: alpha/beta fold hydrolase [Candidatus Competibacteraceae bacterium]
MTVVFVTWSLIAYRANDEARAAELTARVHSALASVDGPFVLGGHSRGAVVASRVAAGGVPQLSGLVLIGTSHPRDDDLSSLAVPVTKVVGTRDGLATPTEVRRNAALLPPQTRWVWVEGGNHSQFGWYGFQPMDRRAAVDAPTQRRMMIAAVLDLLHDVDPAATPTSTSDRQRTERGARRGVTWRAQAQCMGRAG